MVIIVVVNTIVFVPMHEHANPNHQSERNKATPFEMALFYNNSTDQFSMAFRDLRSDRLIRFASGDTPNNVEISGCKKGMKGYGTGLLKLTLNTAENRGLKKFVDCAYFFM